MNAQPQGRIPSSIFSVMQSAMQEGIQQEEQPAMQEGIRQEEQRTIHEETTQHEFSLKPRLKNQIDRLAQRQILCKEELVELLEEQNDQLVDYAAAKARQTAHRIYGRKIYKRGLIEISNYCKNDCYYCGIRRSNQNAQRYRLSKEQILDCCKVGYQLGFRTFVLQGGEDPYYSQEKMIDILSAICATYPDCAITLSLGEKTTEEYEAYYKAGANRYLLRHETATDSHYSALHPPALTLSQRKACLKALKDIGFQTGCGFMVGTPGQKPEHLAEDLIYIHQLQPHMVGIGPFLPHHDTPFKNEQRGDLKQTLLMLALVRLILPEALLPATTALATMDAMGRELGILCGANVIMPNLSPGDVRKKYLLYDDKICTGDEAAESCRNLAERIEKIGYELVNDRGDHKKEGRSL